MFSKSVEESHFRTYVGKQPSHLDIRFREIADSCLHASVNIRYNCAYKMCGIYLLIRLLRKKLKCADLMGNQGGTLFNFIAMEGANSRL